MRPHGSNKAGTLNVSAWRYAAFCLTERTWVGGIMVQKNRGGMKETRKEANMLWTIFVILLILWGLGLITGCTMSGVIHALLVIAIIVVLIQVIQGRRRV
jgi:hypothetical protein